MQNHLLEKNVAREAAERLCSSVEADLLDHKTASFTSIDKTIRESMSKALTRILTPTSSLDLLRNINSTISGSNARPYVISIVGVNGVGKSTNLSKLAYFLLQNQFRVLVVAADTFRSGAVEQLRVHVRNLSELSRRERVGKVEIFEKGYGKDAATVARDAVTFAKNEGKGAEMLYDVVLIDTAGRRHNDTRLMSSLTKFGQLANPDKIFMVGEALVGTDSVAQARNFAKEFVDTKVRLRLPFPIFPRSHPRRLTKCLFCRANSATTAWAWTASSSASAIPWATWWGRWSVWCTPRGFLSCFWVSDSITGI